MATLGELAAQLKLDGAPQMKSGLEGVGKAVGGLKSLIGTLSGPLAALGVSFAAFKSEEGITDALKGVFEAGLELRTLSRTTGQSVGDLKTLQMAFKETGVSADALPGALRLMQSALGGVNDDGQPTAAVFSRLGLSIQQLRGQTAIQQITAIGGALHKLGDQTKEVFAAKQIFGRAGAELLPVLNDPEAIASLGKGLSGQAAIFQRSAETFSRISLDLESLSHKVRGLFVGIADQIAPVLLPLLDKLKSIDLTQLGEQIGGIVRMASKALASGRFGELFSASLEIGIDESINYLAGALPPIGAALGKLLGSDLDAFSDGLTTMFQGLFDLITGGLLRAFQGPVSYLQAGVEKALQQRQFNEDVRDHKRIDLEGYGLMGSSGVQRRIDQLTKLLSRPGSSNDQVGFYSKQLERAEAYRDDPNSFAQVVQSIDQIMAGHAKDAVRFGTGAGKTADEWTVSGQKQIALAPAQLAKAMGDATETIKKLFSDIHRANVVDGQPAKDKLAGLLRQLTDIGAGAAGAGGASAGSLSGLGGSATKMEGDRLAKIGLFVGGGGPALDFNRRTAAATEKTAAGVQTLIQRWAGADKGSMTALWA